MSVREHILVVKVHKIGLKGFQGRVPGVYRGICSLCNACGTRQAARWDTRLLMPSPVPFGRERGGGGKMSVSIVS